MSTVILCICKFTAINVAHYLLIKHFVLIFVSDANACFKIFIIFPSYNYRFPIILIKEKFDNY